MITVAKKSAIEKTVWNKSLKLGKGLFLAHHINWFNTLQTVLRNTTLHPFPYRRAMSSFRKDRAWYTLVADVFRLQTHSFFLNVNKDDQV